MDFAQWRRYNFTLGIGFGLKSAKRYFLIRINSAIEINRICQNHCAKRKCCVRDLMSFSFSPVCLNLPYAIVKPCWLLGSLAINFLLFVISLLFVN